MNKLIFLIISKYFHKVLTMIVAYAEAEGHECSICLETYIPSNKHKHLDECDGQYICSDRCYQYMLEQQECRDYHEEKEAAEVDQMWKNYRKEEQEFIDQDAYTSGLDDPHDDPLDDLPYE